MLSKIHPVLFHATRKDFLLSIFREGLDPAHCGKIHGSMQIRPAEKTVYLSRHPDSNNLHCDLFDGESEVVVVAVDSRFIDEDRIYPDDCLFSAFAEEKVFSLDDVEEIMSAVGCGEEEAVRLLNDWESTPDSELPGKMKFLWRWWLEREGEISVAQCIPPSAILFVRDYRTGAVLQMGSSNEAIAHASPQP